MDDKIKILLDKINIDETLINILMMLKLLK